MTKLEPGTIYTKPTHSHDTNMMFVATVTGSRTLSGITSHPTATPSKIVGRLPPDQLNATEWREEYRLPKIIDTSTYEHRWENGKWCVRDRSSYPGVNLDAMVSGRLVPVPPRLRPGLKAELETLRKELSEVDELRERVEKLEAFLSELVIE